MSESYDYDEASEFVGCVIGTLTIWPSSLIILKRTVGLQVSLDGGQVRRGRNARIVKGSPLARRMLVKYTVPEPIRNEVACEPCVNSSLTFVALHSEGEVHVPLGHAYL